MFVRTALLLELVFFLFLSQLHELSFHFFTFVAGLTELRFASLIFGRGTLTTFTEVDLVLEAHSGSSLSITTRHALKSVHLYPCLLLKPTHKEVFLLFQRSLRWLFHFQTFSFFLAQSQIQADLKQLFKVLYGIETLAIDFSNWGTTLLWNVFDVKDVFPEELIAVLLLESKFMLCFKSVVKNCNHRQLPNSLLHFIRLLRILCLRPHLLIQLLYQPLPRTFLLLEFLSGFLYHFGDQVEGNHILICYFQLFHRDFWH